MPALGGQAADPRRGPAHGGELRQAAGAAALVGRGVGPIGGRDREPLRPWPCNEVWVRLGRRATGRHDRYGRRWWWGPLVIRKMWQIGTDVGLLPLYRRRDDAPTEDTNSELPTATTTTITTEHSYYSPSRINVGEILSMPPRIPAPPGDLIEDYGKGPAVRWLTLGRGPAHRRQYRQAPGAATRAVAARVRR